MEQPVNFLATDIDITTSPKWKVRLLWTALVTSIITFFSVIIFFVFFYTPTNTALLDAVMVLLRIPSYNTDVVAPVVKPHVPRLVEELAIPQISAFSYVVEDLDSKKILASQKLDEAWPLASITKLMTALVLLDLQPDWASSTIVVGADSLDTIMYAGDMYTREELWKAMLIGSSNKAAISLVSSLGMTESEFVALMNEKARSLNFSTSTIFADVTGLSDDNRGVAKDVARLISLAVQEEKISSAMITKDMSLYSNERKKNRDVWSTNWLLLGWVPNDLSIIGAKTGHTISAKYNFALVTKDRDQNRPIIVVVLGAQTHEARFTEALALAQATWKSYQWP